MGAEFSSLSPFHLLQPTDNPNHLQPAAGIELWVASSFDQNSAGMSDPIPWATLTERSKFNLNAMRHGKARPSC
jgi:hypothetical protein